MRRLVALHLLLATAGNRALPGARAAGIPVPLPLRSQQKPQGLATLTGTDRLRLDRAVAQITDLATMSATNPGCLCIHRESFTITILCLGFVMASIIFVDSHTMRLLMTRACMAALETNAPCSSAPMIDLRPWRLHVPRIILTHRGALACWMATFPFLLLVRLPTCSANAWRTLSDAAGHNRGDLSLFQPQGIVRYLCKKNVPSE